MTVKSIEVRKNGRRGQGMTEYIIIVAMIAIAAVGIITLFGDNIRKLFASSSDTLAGNTSVKNNGVEGSGKGALNGKTIKNFGENNSY